MTEEKIKIYRVAVSLTKNGFKEDVIEYEGRETISTFIVSGIEGTIREYRRIKKSQLMKLYTGVFKITHTHIHYMTWCLEEQIDRARAMCKEWVFENAKQIREEASALFRYLDE